MLRSQVSRVMLCMWWLRPQLSLLLYAVPSWWGYSSGDDRPRLDRFLLRAQRMGYLPSTTPAMAVLVGAAEDRMLHTAIWNSAHALMNLFPPTIRRRYSLRPRPHDFELPSKDDRNLIPRILYRSLVVKRQVEHLISVPEIICLL